MLVTITSTPTSKWTSLSVSQDEGASRNGTFDIQDYETELTWSISSHMVLAQIKIDVIQCAIARCLKVCISCEGVQIQYLLGSGSKGTLIRQSYFIVHLLPIVNS